MYNSSNDPYAKVPVKKNKAADIQNLILGWILMCLNIRYWMESW